jgi:hypothetical protein
MSEAEWLACTDPTQMLAFLQAKVSAAFPKGATFALMEGPSERCRAERRGWERLSDECWSRWSEVDGLASYLSSGSLGLALWSR